MSRTVRNVIVYNEDREELNSLKLLFSAIEETNEKHYFSNNNSYSKKSINDNIKKAKNIKEVKDLLKEEIKSEESWLRMITADKGNWRGVVFRATKEYSNMKSRSGKRKMLTNICKYVKLNDMQNFDDEFVVFDEPNLGSIRGALWYFD